jgi:hypothetical protein
MLRWLFRPSSRTPFGRQGKVPRMTIWLWPRLKAPLISPFNLFRQPLVVVRKSQHHVLGELVLHPVCESTDFIGASTPELGIIGRETAPY